MNNIVKITLRTTFYAAKTGGHFYPIVEAGSSRMYYVEESRDATDDEVAMINGWFDCGSHEFEGKFRAPKLSTPK